MLVNNALSVTQLNGYIKSLMDSDAFLRSVVIRGEISNFKPHGSGHLYFTLKDPDSEISAVMFRGAAARLSFAPKNGMQVTVYGHVAVYEKTGKYQLYADTMTNDGAGALYEQYARLLERLKAEGLFAEDRKKAIPNFPRKIGIITSPTGAAIRDMINVTGRRYPPAELLISPALVQGADAPSDLCRALRLLDAVGGCDVIIIGRGGGSIEDLWAFNDEELVRAVANAKTPIISAVGHETDTTLCDYAADMRAPTPSAAAEQAVPDRESLMQSIDLKLGHIDTVMGKKISFFKSSVCARASHIRALSPGARVLSMRDRIRTRSEILGASVESSFRELRARLAGEIERLEAVNPLAVIKRGYSMTLGEAGEVISSVERVNTGDVVSVILSDGAIKAKVEEIKR